MLSAASAFFGWISSIWGTTTVPSLLPVTLHRLRDAGKHWAWIFIGLIPVIGSIWLIWLLVQPSSALLA